MRASTAFAALTAVLTLLPVRAFAQHEHEHTHGAPERLGHVHFPTSCRADLQPAFERGVALLHSFAYAEAAQAFAAVATQDSACAMAQWGIAMSDYHVIWGPPTPAEFASGKAAADKATALAPRATPRERDYIAAIAAYYQGEGVPHPTRVVAFEKAMAQVAERHPDDHEAAIFHALALLGVAYNSPPDKTYARQRQAAEILNRLLPLEPDHPGIAHYMIHSFDYPELAELALPAARAYSKIAPSAPHALHMPSHIFTRLGMWKESIEPTSPRRRWRRPGWRAPIRGPPPSTPSTRWTISSTRTCRPDRTTGHARSSIRWPWSRASMFPRLRPAMRSRRSPRASRWSAGPGRKRPR
jgi:hypothetical protein